MVPSVVPTLPPPSQATSDDHFISLWLHDKSANAERAYRADVTRFRVYTGKELRAVTLDDLQRFADSLSATAEGEKLQLTPAGRRAVAAVKSLLTFGQRIGYLQFNVGAAVRLRRNPADRLAARILPESAIHRLLFAVEDNPRDHALVRFTYATGARVSEVCRLTWRDIQEQGDGAATVIIRGKGGMTRNVRIESPIWDELRQLRQFQPESSPVFVSRRGGALDPSQVWRIVRGAAERAGVGSQVSPHWLRHAHASHALDHGAPLPLVRDTLGHASVATTNSYLHAKPGESSGKYLVI